MTYVFLVEILGGVRMIAAAVNVSLLLMYFHYG
jgi:hypothetical protein